MSRIIDVGDLKARWHTRMVEKMHGVFCNYISERAKVAFSDPAFYESALSFITVLELIKEGRRIRDLRASGDIGGYAILLNALLSSPDSLLNNGFNAITLSDESRESVPNCRGVIISHPEEDHYHLFIAGSGGYDIEKSRMVNVRQAAAMLSQAEDPAQLAISGEIGKVLYFVSQDGQEVRGWVSDPAVSE